MLRDYQEDLIEQVREAYRRGYRSPCIVLPCGGGKSIIVAEIAKRTTYKENNVLFLIHRRELRDQIIRTFSRWGVDMSLCDVMMVQTAARRAEKLRPPSLIITDENHHCLAASYKTIYEEFPKARFLGVTATPIRLNGDGLGDVNDILIEGVSAKWLIGNNFLAPYDYYAPSVSDLTGIKISHGEYVASDIEKLLAKSTVFGDVIGCYKKLAKGKQAICYCASIRHSEEMAAAFRKSGIEAAHIDGSTPAAEREKLIDDFRRGAIDILCNVDLISEGFDVPDCECAILLRPTKSLTLYIQQSMRCMRYKPGKRAVIIDHVGNYARFGMPDDDRKWSLEKRDKADKKRSAETPVNARMCPRCYAVFRSADKCPKCGFVFPKQEHQLETASAELQKIEGFKLDFSSPEECKNYGELVAYAKKHGYKQGWAYYQARNRGML